MKQGYIPEVVLFLIFSFSTFLKRKLTVFDAHFPLGLKVSQIKTWQNLKQEDTHFSLTAELSSNIVEVTTFFFIFLLFPFASL